MLNSFFTINQDDYHPIFIKVLLERIFILRNDFFRLRNRILHGHIQLLIKKMFPNFHVQIFLYSKSLFNFIKNYKPFFIFFHVDSEFLNIVKSFPYISQKCSKKITL